MKKNTINHQQLLLDIEQPAYPRFDKLLGKANQELIFRLQHENDHFLYLWGAQGTGKSHILQAWVGRAIEQGKKAIYIHPKISPLTDLAEQYDYIAIDQIQTLTVSEQAELFYLFNQIRNTHQGHLLLAADVPPNQLIFREDLRTRMAFCLIYEVQPLCLDEKIAALSDFAKARQMNIDKQVLAYLVNHSRSDLPSLFNTFNELANYSFATKKKITIDLLRHLLTQQG